MPVYNEDAATVSGTVVRIENVMKTHGWRYEIIIVDDGSSPPAQALNNVRLVRHPRNLGNGAAIKTGARTAKGEIVLFMDADGQHKADDIPALLNTMFAENFDMVVGARQARHHASVGRRIANSFYNRLASFMTGYRVDDLTSGFRAARTKKFREFLYLLPNGFSYPTTSTMAFFRSGYAVAYVPIVVEQRNGASKIKWLKDGLRFFIIILKIGTLFSPMRLFLPTSALFFLLGLTHYVYTYIHFGRFTNMSALLFIASMFAFLIGILSEQISSLHYKSTNRTGDE